MKNDDENEVSSILFVIEYSLEKSLNFQPKTPTGSGSETPIDGHPVITPTSKHRKE